MCFFKFVSYRVYVVSVAVDGKPKVQKKVQMFEVATERVLHHNEITRQNNE